MTAKEYLSQGRWLNQKILNRRDELNQLRELAKSIKSTDYEQPAVQSSGKPDAAFATLIEKITDSEAELSAEVENYLCFRDKIRHEIQKLPEDEEKILLEKRYICLKPWSAIADEMGYVKRHITRKHADALQSFAKINYEVLKNVPKCP